MCTTGKGREFGFHVRGSVPRGLQFQNLCLIIEEQNVCFKYIPPSLQEAFYRMGRAIQSDRNQALRHPVCFRSYVLSPFAGDRIETQFDRIRKLRYVFHMPNMLEHCFFR